MWEYRIRNIDKAKIENTLNELGMDGWELVAYDYRGTGLITDYAHCVFKRKKICNRTSVCLGCEVCLGDSK